MRHQQFGFTPILSLSYFIHLHFVWFQCNIHWWWRISATKWWPEYTAIRPLMEETACIIHPHYGKDTWTKCRQGIRLCRLFRLTHDWTISIHISKKLFCTKSPEGYIQAQFCLPTNDPPCVVTLFSTSFEMHAVNSVPSNVVMLQLFTWHSLKNWALSLSKFTEYDESPFIHKYFL